MSFAPALAAPAQHREADQGQHYAAGNREGIDRHAEDVEHLSSRNGRGGKNDEHGDGSFRGVCHAGGAGLAGLDLRKHRGADYRINQGENRYDRLELLPHGFRSRRRIIAKEPPPTQVCQGTRSSPT